ncbi:MAG: hypothetical protein LUG51_01600 [Tannerellaceae bacterium]|nr:hypothetical protein [Tannerellaceae bacterium]
MRLKGWEQDLDISGAFRVSAVPVYQEIARRIGVERMQHYLRLFHYGEMDVRADNLDVFWLEGESAITSYQQVYFLKQLYTGSLPVSDRAMEQTRRIMLYEQTDQYRLSGKTGAAVRSGKDIAWFVGWIETADNTWIFATNTGKEELLSIENFLQIRIDITWEILEKLGIIIR